MIGSHVLTSIFFTESQEKDEPDHQLRAEMVGMMMVMCQDSTLLVQQLNYIKPAFPSILWETLETTFC